MRPIPFPGVTWTLKRLVPPGFDIANDVGNLQVHSLSKSLVELGEAIVDNQSAFKGVLRSVLRPITLAKFWPHPVHLLPTKIG